MNSSTNVRYMMALSMCIGALMLFCTMGGSAEQGNARISGAVSGGSGGSAPVDVQLVPEGFNPFGEGGAVVCSTLADSGGRYLFEDVPFGSYYLYAFDDKHTLTLLDGPFVIDNENPDQLNATLQKSSIVTIAGNDSSGAFYIKGTSRVYAVDVDTLHRTTLIGVPAGINDVMKYDSSSKATSLYLHNLEIFPGDSIMIGQGNRPPRISAASLYLPSIVYVDTLYTIDFHPVDPDSDSVVCRLLTALESYTFDSAGGTFTWKPAPSELPVSGILFKAVDRHGAFSMFKWEFSVQNKAPAPTPDAPEGVSECLAESTAVFTLQSANCLTASSLHRISWGDGDTSAFTDKQSLQHAWLHPGTYPVRAQMQCGDYALPSAWSLPRNVTVTANRKTPAPLLAAAGDTIHGYDTAYYEQGTGSLVNDTVFEVISLHVVPLTCTATPLYRYYCNGKDLAGWTADTGFAFTPDSFGYYVFAAAAWCDTADASPSEPSAPCTLLVTHGLRRPVISGSTSYGPVDPIEVTINLESTVMVDGPTVSYRLSVGFEELGRENHSAGIGTALIDTCADGQTCPVSIELYNFEPTRWFTGTLVQLTLLQPPGSCLVRAQAAAKGRSDSDWSEVFIIKPE